MLEQWKDIDGFGGIYQVSNLGRIRSVDHYASNGRTDILYRGRIRKLKLLPNGYVVVSLKRKHYYVHRLVAQAFLLNPTDLPEVNHKDEDKTNNCLDNLEWCTHSYNVTYNNAHVKRGLKNRGKLINNKPIVQLALSGEVVATYESATEACRKTGIDFSHIRKAVKGVVKSARGFLWKELNEK